VPFVEKLWNKIFSSKDSNPQEKVSGWGYIKGDGGSALEAINAAPEATLPSVNETVYPAPSGPTFQQVTNIGTQYRLKIPPDIADLVCMNFFKTFLRPAKFASRCPMTFSVFRDAIVNQPFEIPVTTDTAGNYALLICPWNIYNSGSSVGTSPATDYLLFDPYLGQTISTIVQPVPGPLYPS